MKNTQNNLHYVGTYSTLQTQGNSKYMNQGALSLSNEQRRLYSRLLIGLKYYSKQELYAMNSTTKNGIKKRNLKAQNIINLWKQEIMITMSNSIFKQYNLSENETIVDDVTNKPTIIKSNLCNRITKTDPEFRCTLSFKDLGINKEKIINKLMHEKLLPSNFMTL